MTRTIQPCLFLVVMLLWLALATTTVGAAGEGYVRIENRWKSAEQLNVETGALASSLTQPGWQSADWLLEPVGDGVLSALRTAGRARTLTTVKLTSSSKRRREQW